MKRTCQGQRIQICLLGVAQLALCLLLLSDAMSCPILCDPMDLSPAGSSVHGISQASILEWVAISSSTGSSPHRDQT